jgi:hypothetical protein
MASPGLTNSRPTSWSPTSAPDVNELAGAAVVEQPAEQRDPEQDEREPRPLRVGERLEQPVLCSTQDPSQVVRTLAGRQAGA